MANSPAATNQITQEGGRLFSCSFLTQQVPKAHQACSLGRVRETLNNKLVTDKPDDLIETEKKGVIQDMFEMLVNVGHKTNLFLQYKPGSASSIGFCGALLK